jgi:hypothetical protein
MSCFSNVTHQAFRRGQLHQALSTEYACLKDLCCYDEASEWMPRICVIHLDPRDEGNFDVVAPQLVKGNPPVLLVETHFLDQADHAE